jgi:pimeloyl-ACP methyl ester carboxylesterase
VLKPLKMRAGPAVALALVLLSLSAVGCQTNQQRWMTAERLDAGLIVSLDGIGGFDWGPQWLRKGLDEAGIQQAIVIYDWSKGPSGFFVGDLVDEKRNRESAQDLARVVAAYKAAKPGRPVSLIGHSGGTAVVVWALEALPPGVQVDRVILLAPALSPDYNLATALGHVRSRLYVMHSVADAGLMGAGTAVFGTMDREHSASAGWLGFQLPKDLTEPQRAEYAKVRQVKWSADMLGEGNWGGHMAWTTSWFARQQIAPILTGTNDPGRPLIEPQATAALRAAR